MRFVLLAEVFQSGEYGVRSRLTETTERAFLYLIGEVEERIKVFHDALSLGDAFQDFKHPFRADAAEGALPAGLFLDEGQEEFGDVDDACRLVHNHHSAGAHDSARGIYGFIVYRGVEQRFRDAASRGASELDCLELLVLRDAPGDVKDDLAKRHPHRNLREAALFNFAGERENLCSSALADSVFGELRRAVQDDPGNIRDSLHVVDIRRFAENAAVRRERRVAAAAFPAVPR